MFLKYVSHRCFHFYSWDLHLFNISTSIKHKTVPLVLGALVFKDIQSNYVFMLISNLFQDDTLFLKTSLGQEDCLVLNVYVPGNGDRERSDLLPVMVFIHGGAFFLGSGSKDFYGPERILDYDVVSVLTTSNPETLKNRFFVGKSFLLMAFCNYLFLFLF